MNEISLQKQYDSLISTSKELKAKKEAGGTAFGAQILAQSYDLELMAQASMVSQATARVTSAGTSGFNDSNILNSNLQSNINQVKYSPNTYGYSIDSQGFMGADFNKAAGLPEDFKIHKSTLDEIYDFNERSYIHKPTYTAKTFENIDMADTIKQYYKVFQSVVGSNDKQTYTSEDLNRLPKGFSISGNDAAENGNYLPDVSSYKVTNVYKTGDQFDEAKALERELSMLTPPRYTYRLNLSSSEIGRDNGGGLKFNPDMSIYKTDGGYTKEGVFVGFLKNFKPKASDSGETELTDQIKTYSILNIEQGKKDIDFIKRVNSGNDMARDKIMQEEMTIAELLRYRPGKTNQILSDKDREEYVKTIKERVNALASMTSV